MQKRSMRKRLLKEVDYDLLKQKLYDSFSVIDEADDEADLKILWSGETAFLWESPLAMSAEEAINMARQAAAEMAPEPGRAILAAILYVVTDLKGGLDTFEEIINPIQQIIPRAGTTMIVAEFCDEDEPGICFLLATSEGREETQ